MKLAPGAFASLLVAIDQHDGALASRLGDNVNFPCPKGGCCDHSWSGAAGQWACGCGLFQTPVNRQDKNCRQLCGSSADNCAPTAPAEDEVKCYGYEEAKWRAMHGKAPQPCHHGRAQPTCPADQVEVAVAVTTDEYPTETTWTVSKISGGQAVLSGGPYNAANTQFSDETGCIDAARFEFKILDTYGDGICCGYGNGGYEVLMDGVSQGTGGAFGREDTLQFGYDGPKCYEENRNLSSCMLGFDEQATDDCAHCQYRLYGNFAPWTGAIEPSPDVCAQLADETAADQNVCDSIVECYLDCLRVEEDTREACAKQWEGFAGCAGEPVWFAQFHLKRPCLAVWNDCRVPEGGPRPPSPAPTRGPVTWADSRPSFAPPRRPDYPEIA